MRDTCYRCFRPKPHCYCAGLKALENRTKITILQHPRERFHPIGTARIAELGLKNCDIRVNDGWRYSRPLKGESAPRLSDFESLRFSPGAGLLYPGDDSLPLAPAAVDELVVLDGTWHHAHTLFRDVPGLVSLPRYSFVPERESQYRLRKEPRRDYVSTVEAVVYALRALEPELTELGHLLDVFSQMIDRQAHFVGAGRTGRARSERRPANLRRFPRAFAEEASRVVIAYGETPKTASGRRELLHWVAYRPSTGEYFERILKTESVPTRLLELAELTAERVQREAVGVAEFAKGWERFAGTDSVAVGWNQGTLLPLSPFSQVPRARAYLKAAYHTLRPQLDRSQLGGGASEQLLAHEGLDPVLTPFSGRAGRRLGNAIALFQLLRSEAGEKPSA